MRINLRLAGTAAAALAAALSLSCAKAQDKPQSVDPSAEIAARFDAASHRLVEMSDSGWVVSRNAAGGAEHLGDSLIWTGIAMGALDCELGKVPEAALQRMLAEHGGVAYRHPSLPDQVSLDGLLGLWWGIQERTRRCPEAAPGWAALLPEHAEKTIVPPYFHAVLDQVMAELGLGTGPDESARGHLGAEVAAWSIAVVSQRAAAYRLHLGFLALSVVDAPKGRDVYCDTVKDAKIPLLENFCGRDGLKAWIDAFQFDAWEYSHQRSPVWEAPDGNGLETPGLDLIVAIRDAYNI